MLGLLACVGHPACDGLVTTAKHQGFALTAIGAQSFGCLEYLFLFWPAHAAQPAKLESEGKQWHQEPRGATAFLDQL